MAVPSKEYIVNGRLTTVAKEAVRLGLSITILYNRMNDKKHPKTLQEACSVPTKKYTTQKVNPEWKGLSGKDRLDPDTINIMDW